mmetsp:Transcript_43384/g.94473  ORF Transcript_43384/g.94473 Transcript_43384/m.94473 type:complete len:201 (+) Transcript_43384:1223-1825(+)
MRRRLQVPDRAKLAGWRWREGGWGEGGRLLLRGGRGQGYAEAHPLQEQVQGHGSHALPEHAQQPGHGVQGHQPVRGDAGSQQGAAGVERAEPRARPLRLLPGEAPRQVRLRPGQPARLHSGLPDGGLRLDLQRARYALGPNHQHVRRPGRRGHERAGGPVRAVLQRHQSIAAETPVQGATRRAIGHAEAPGQGTPGCHRL